MNGKDLERLIKKIVFMRMKDGFINYVYIEKIDGEDITAVNAHNRVSIFPADEVLTVRELDQRERMKFLEKRSIGGF